MRYEMEYVIGIDYNNTDDVDTSNVKPNLLLIYDTKDNEFTTSYYKGLNQFNDSSDFGVCIMNELNNIRNSSNSTEDISFRVYIIGLEYFLELYELKNVVSKQEFNLNTQYLLNGSFAQIFDSDGYLYSQGDNLEIEERAESYYSFFTSTNECRLESITELINYDTELLDCIINLDRETNEVTKYIVDNNIVTDLISDEVRRLGKVTLEGNHRM